jgi:2-aminoadipate transaminase
MSNNLIHKSGEGLLSSIVTFDSAPADGIMHLGIGQPSADLLPVELMKTASDAFFAEAQPLDLNYGELMGDQRFRQSLAGLLSREYGAQADAETLVVTAGNSQALGFVCERFTQKGDVVFVEEPTYFLAHQIFRDYDLQIVGIPMDAQGMDVDFLQQALKTHQPVLLYTIPAFHNPGGQTLSAERRQRIIELSQQHGFVIAADEVYQMLYYADPPPAAFGTMIDQAPIVSMGSFSKILAPGLRLGWLQAAGETLAQIKRSGVLNSGGSFNHLASHLARKAIDLGLQEEHIRFLRQAYGSRLRAMDTALQEHLGNLATWHLPDGGYFFWLKLPDSFDCSALKTQAHEYKTGFQAGAVFSCNGELQNYLRLSFAHYNEAEITQGIERLAQLLRR